MTKYDDTIAELEALALRETLTAGETERFNNLARSAERLRGEMETRDAKIAKIREAAANPSCREAGADPRSNRGSRNMTGNLDRSLWGGDDSYRGTAAPDLQRRAINVLERASDFAPVDPAARDRVGALVEQGEAQTSAARWVLATSNPAYLSAVSKVAFGANEDGRMRWSDDERSAYLRAEEFRASMSTTAANGGYMIPFELDPTVILTNAGAANPFRAISRVESTATGVWHGVASSGVSAAWGAENTEVADASPVLTQPTVTAVRGDAHIQASLELVHDSTIAAQVGMMFADAKNNLEATAFATGSGSTQPEGIVTRLAATTASRVSATTNGSFGSVDLFAMVNSLPARAQANASWVSHWGVQNLVRQFTSGASPTAANLWTDLGGGTPPDLLGAPIYKSSAMTSSLSAATASSEHVMVLGNFAEFLIVDALGSTIVYNPVVVGSSQRPTGQVSWTLFFRTGSDTLDPGQFRLLVC